MIYIKDKNKVYKFKDIYGNLLLLENINNPDIIPQYDSIYFMDNYKGLFHLQFHNSHFHLYYKDILFGSCSSRFGLNFMIIIECLLETVTLESWLFEHKVKREELTEFFQYVLWDDTSSQLWHMKKFNQNLLPSDLSINIYKGEISIHYNKVGRLYLYYKEAKICKIDCHISPDSIRFITLLGIDTPRIPFSTLRIDPDSIQQDFDIFKKHISGTSDILLEKLIKLGYSEDKTIVLGKDLWNTL